MTEITVQTRYLNRELSWIAFNRRVLEEAQDERNPLIERGRFLAIVSSNLDEFCMVRLAGLHRNKDERSCDASGLTPNEALQQVRAAVHELSADQYLCWNNEVQPRLREEGFHIVSPADWTAEDRETLFLHYRNTLSPVLTPQGVDSGRPMPMLSTGSIHIITLVQPPADDPREGPLQAFVTVPSGRRLVALEGKGRFVLVEDVVEAFLDDLFAGFQVTARAQFRMTRDGDLEIDEEEATDLLLEIEEELRHRGHGNAVRLELRHGTDEELRSRLLSLCALSEEDLVDIDGPLDLTMLMGMNRYLPRDDLSFPSFTQAPPPVPWEDPFASIREGEVLLHHPFDSFRPIVELIDKAANDDKVLAIKQTLYRVSGDSPIVRALMRAARSGKQVTVLVELKARFDEEANIRWARRLEEAGAHVIYGLLGYKVHAKLLLIIRRDEDGIRRYCQLGTGNYNDKTARLYTDISYLTCNEAVGRDVTALFNVITGFAQPPEWERLSVAPTTMRRDFVALIEREADFARQGKGGRIIAKFNSLVDTGICDALYAASQAGVEIDLIVRGICILRPGVEGLSENIRVRSIVGRFLEHSRIYHFAGAGNPTYSISSADWMERNLDRRVESLVRIEDPVLQEQLQALLQLYLEDQSASRMQQPDGSYRRASGQLDGCAQNRLLAASLERQRQEEAPGGRRHQQAMQPARKPR